jgi:S-DNA-T family DNA segregation ATPase FtsK/SpoIIIE
VILEEYPGLLRAADAHDKDLGKQIRARVSRLLAESAKVAGRVIMLAQRPTASVVGELERAMCSVRISFRCDNRSAVELLHPGTDPVIADEHVRALPGVALITQPGSELMRMRAPMFHGGYSAYYQAVSRG